MVEIRKPTEIEKEQLKRTILMSERELVMFGNNCYCTKCDRRFKLTDNELKQTRYSKICPKCYEEVEIKKGTRFYGNNVIIETKDGVFGYWVDVRVGARKTTADYTFTYSNVDNKRFVRLIKIKSMSSYYSNHSLRPIQEGWGETKEWRKVRHNSYEQRSLLLQKQFSWEKRTKKDYLNNYGNFIFKSNQKKLAIDNLMSPEQLKAMVMFNINDVDTIYRYRGYLRQNQYSLSAEEKYTPMTLKYLSKNKIKLSDYKDYEQLCKEVGRKLDRPKDFKLWHDRLVEFKEMKKNEKYSKGIIKQFNKLKKYSYGDIKPLESLEEITHVATTLHNCMARLYTEPYSKGKTELYYMSKNGKPIIAIEVNNGRLIQARADHNEDPTRSQKRVVNKWFKEVRLAI